MNWKIGRGDIGLSVGYWDTGFDIGLDFG